MSIANVSVIDCETTGTSEDAEVCEVAYVRLPNGQIHEDTYARQSFVRPILSIPAEAKAIHHITDEMVEGAPLIDELIADWKDPEAIYVAHNARFDQRFLGGLGDKWVCTYKCSMIQWPDAPGHGNQVLSYWLDLHRPPSDSGHAHRALFDAWTTVWIYRALIDLGWTHERMLKVSSEPVLLPSFRFGKHANQPLQEIPSSYLQWMQTQDFDEDVLHTVKTELDRRAS